jgi:hypothetical protein
MQEPNPYEPPAEAQPPPKFRTTNAKIWTLVILGLFSIPAAGAAFFTTCFAAVMISEGTVQNLDTLLLIGFGSGSLAGLLVLGFFGYRMMKIYRRP